MQRKQNVSLTSPATGSLLRLLLVIMFVMCLSPGLYALETNLTDTIDTSSVSTAEDQVEKVNDNLQALIDTDSTTSQLQSSGQGPMLQAIAQAAPAAAEKKTIPVNVTAGYWDEYGTNRNDYGFYMATIAYDKMTFRTDVFSTSSNKRFWFTYGKFPVVNNKNVSVLISPAVGFTTKNNQYYGAEMWATLPKLGFSWYQRSYAGSPASYHQSWFHQKLHPNLGIQWYRFTKEGYSPDSYLGPKVFLGPFNFYYGWSTNRPGARAIGAFGSFKF